MTCPFHNADVLEVSDKKENLDYDNYLQLDKILTANLPQSKLKGKESHTEHLFITIHQSFEIWFKQLIHDLRSVIKMFEKPTLADANLLFIHNCLNRVSGILISLGGQFNLLETMSPMEFLEFRSKLGTASGFQSWQFRIFENLMGLRPEWRNRYAKRDYKEFLRPEHQKLVIEAENGPNLFGVTCAWLARCPFLFDWQWDFWSAYQDAVEKMCDEEIDEVLKNSEITAENREEKIQEVEERQKFWQHIFDREVFEVDRKKGKVRWTYEAFQGAIFINLYRNNPALQMPFQLLKDFMDIETAMRTFRTRHANMVQRMIGVKQGTGGSSGFYYLRSTASKHCIFNDLFNMSSYYLPENLLPTLPDKIVEDLRRSSPPPCNQTRSPTFNSTKSPISNSTESSI